MQAGPLAGVLRHLRMAARRDEGAQVGDAELLERFLAHRDEGAFELLVRRHGPMVLGVCKRVLVQEIRARERPDKVAVLKSASELASIEPPSTAEVLRALARLPRSVPTVVEVFRDDMEVVTERLVRQVDPPRYFPHVGAAELHHDHWKCTVYYRETVESSDPHLACARRQRVEVVYFNKDYLVPTR